jgi:hypothetical protein
MLRSRGVQRAAAAVVAAGYAGLAVTIVWKGTGDGNYDAPFEYVIGYAFVVVLLSLAVAIGIFRDRSSRGATVVVAGCLVLVFGVMWGNVTGDDPAWFAAFGVPGNLAIFVGSLMVAVRVWREGTRGRLLAVLLGLYAPVGLVGAELGGGVLAAVLWLLVAAGAVHAAPVTSRRGPTRVEPIAAGVRSEA